MLFSRMVGGLGNQLFQTAAFFKYRSKKEKVIISFPGDIYIPKRENCLNYIFEIPYWLYWESFLSNPKKEFLVPSNLSLKEKRIILLNENVIV